VAGSNGHGESGKDALLSLVGFDTHAELCNGTRAPFVVSVPLVPLLTLPVLVERFEPSPPRPVPALM